MSWRKSLCAMVLVVSGCASQGAETTDPPDQTTTIAESTTSAPPTTSTTVESETSTTANEWDSIKAWRGGPAGEYRMATFAPAFKFTTASSFLPTTQCNDLTTIVKSQGDEVFGFWFYRFDVGTMAETLAYLESQEALAVSEPEDTEVGGAPAIVVSVDLVDNWIVGRHCDTSFQTARGQSQLAYIVDVAGETVTILIDEAELSDTDVQTVMGSIEWKDLSSG